MELCERLEKNFNNLRNNIWNNERIDNSPF